MMINRNKKPTTKQIISSHASGSSFAFTGNIASQSGNMANIYPCGTLAANTPKNIITVNGSGCVEILALQQIVAQVQNAKIQVLIDGANVFENTPLSVGANGAIVVVGDIVSTSSLRDSKSPMDFAQSFVVNVQTDFAGSNYFNVVCKYKLK